MMGIEKRIKKARKRVLLIALAKSRYTYIIGGASAFLIAGLCVVVSFVMTGHIAWLIAPFAQLCYVIGACAIATLVYAIVLAKNQRKGD